MKYRFYIPLILQIALLLSFFYFGYRADDAMDKSGIGDVESWRYWENLAGISFYSTFAVWVFAFGLAVFHKAFRKQLAKQTIVFPLLFYIFGMFSVVFV